MPNLKRIRDLLSEKKLRIKDLSEYLGITEQAVHDMINRNSTKVETLEKTAKFFGIPINYFFEEDQKIIEAQEAGTAYIKILSEKERQLLYDKIKLMEENKLLREEKFTLEIKLKECNDEIETHKTD